MGVPLICACLLHLHLLLGSSPSPAAAQPSPARALDATLQGYAYRALSARPRTGVVFNATALLPGDLAGVAVSALRLRSGSLRRRGFAGGYFEFGVPARVAVRPYVERVVLVYQNLGSLSEQYYPVPGYTHLTPVLGLLVYDAANLSAVGLQELGIAVVPGSPISVNFGNAWSVPPGGAVPRCVAFGLDGVPQFRDMEAANVCSTDRQGHFSIVVNSSEIAPSPAPGPGPAPAPAPAPAPSGLIAPLVPSAKGRSKSSLKVWKISVSVVGAAVALGLLASLMLCMVRYKREKKLEVMERNAEVGETLRMAQVGRTQAPVAFGTRTQPMIENEYAA